MARTHAKQPPTVDPLTRRLDVLSFAGVIGFGALAVVCEAYGPVVADWLGVGSVDGLCRWSALLAGLLLFFHLVLSVLLSDTHRR